MRRRRVSTQTMQESKRKARASTLAAATLKTNRKASVQTVRTSMEKRTFPIGGEAQTKNEQAMPRNIQYGGSRNHAGKTQKLLLAQPRKEARKNTSELLGTPLGLKLHTRTCLRPRALSVVYDSGSRRVPVTFDMKLAASCVRGAKCL